MTLGSARSAAVTVFLWAEVLVFNGRVFAQREIPRELLPIFLVKRRPELLVQPSPCSFEQDELREVLSNKRCAESVKMALVATLAALGNSLPLTTLFGGGGRLAHVEWRVSGKGR